MKYSSVTSHLNCPSESSYRSPSISSWGQHLANDYKLSIETPEFKLNFSTAFIIASAFGSLESTMNNFYVISPEKNFFFSLRFTFTTVSTTAFTLSYNNSSTS